MAWTLVSPRHPSFPQICQLLSAIYPGIQLDSCTTYLNAKDLEYQVSSAQEGYSRG